MVALLLFAGLTLVFWSFGDRISRALRLQTEPPAQRFAFSSALSYGAVTLLVFTLAVLRQVTPAVCGGLVVLMAAVSIRELRGNLDLLTRGLRGQEWKRVLLPGGSWQGWAGWLTGLVLLLGLVQSLAPLTGWDTGHMHFAAVKMMIREQGLSPRPEVWFHRTGEFYMVYLLGMELGGETLAKLLSFGVSPLAVLLAAAGSERLRPGSGRVAAAIVGLSPLYSAFTGYEFLELPILMYLLASFYALQRYRVDGGAAWAAASGLFCGLAFGVKASAFPVLLLLLPALLLAVRREGRRSGPVLAAGLLGFLPGGASWPLWNKLTTGSFVYAEYLGDPPAVAEAALSPLQGALSIVGSLLTVSEIWSDSAGPFVVAAAAGVLLLRGPAESRLPAAMFAGSIVFYVLVVALRMKYYLNLDPHGRYLGPFLLGFGALAGAPLIAWSEAGPRFLRIALIAALLVPAAPLLLLKAGKAAVAAPAAFGFESRSRYLSKKIETYEACEILNGLPDPGVKVLFLADRSYYLDRPVVPDQFWQGVAGREDLLRRAREQGVTHVLYEPQSPMPAWLRNPDPVFGSAPFREIGRWPRKEDWVRLYALERP